MSSIDIPLRGGRFGKTTRRDLWWAQPLFTFLGLSLFIVYATWAAFQGWYYKFGPYLSPFYSPEILGIRFLPTLELGLAGSHLGRQSRQRC